MIGGFAPKSESAEELAKSMGTYTVLTGSVTRGRENSKSLQMSERPLMTSDEIKSIKRGNFIVLKKGFNPMKSKFNLFPKWGITFENIFTISENEEHKVEYANKEELRRAMSYGTTRRNIKKRESLTRSMSDTDFDDYLKTD